MSSKTKKSIIEVKGASVAVLSKNRQDYISLTDIARYKDAERTDYLISNWLRNRNTIEFLGIWEQLNNPDFNPIEFDGIRKQAGLNSFILTAKRWIDSTGAVGLVSATGRYGGTYAHKDIAFEFASWVSVEFKLFLIKEFQRLKDDENDRLQLGWNLQRTLAKINYHLKKVFADNELDENSVIRNFRITAADGKTYDTQHYPLQAIRAVLNMANSPQLNLSNSRPLKFHQLCYPIEFDGIKTIQPARCAPCSPNPTSNG